MFEAEGSSLEFTFVNRTVSEEKIMFLDAVCTNVYCWRTVCKGIARWGTERAMCSGSTVFWWMSKSPAVLTLMWGRNVKFNLILEGSSYVYTVWKILSFECNFSNIWWVLVAATRFNSKAGHMSSIMLVCNQFKKIRRTVRSTDAHWAEFIGYENSTSMSVELGIRGHWERFPINLFEGEHSFSLGFWVNND